MLAHREAIKSMDAGRSFALPHPDQPVVQPDAGFLITRTSGTTWQPKWAKIGWEAFGKRCEILMDVIGPGGGVAAFMPQRHSYAVIARAAPLLHGRSIVSIDHLRDEIAVQEGVTCLISIGMNIISRRAAIAGKFPDLQKVIVAGHKLPQAVMDMIRLKMGCEVVNLYGSTEFSTIAISSGATPALRFLPSVEHRVVDGELQVRRPETLADGYVGEPLEMDGDWYRTGDIIETHPDGSFSIVERRS